jgi:hypothetical protein
MKGRRHPGGVVSYPRGAAARGETTTWGGSAVGTKRWRLEVEEKGKMDRAGLQE